MRDLSSEEQALVERARQAARSAYCPYSRFPVGAVVESEELGLTVGVNIENASYGLAVCAERVALFSAVAQGAKHFRRLAVSCLDARSDDPPGSRMPCGACRQVMAEFLDADCLVLVDGIGAVSVAELLPTAFQLATRPFFEAAEQDRRST
jgi:cytidine deaminase